VDDFWAMVVQEQIDAVVMLCDCEEMGRRKCAQYWPRDEVSFGLQILLNFNIQILANANTMQQWDQSRIPEHSKRGRQPVQNKTCCELRRPSKPANCATLPLERMARSRSSNQPSCSIAASQLSEPLRTCSGALLCGNWTYGNNCGTLVSFFCNNFLK
jgi:hypothetical protein